MLFTDLILFIAVGETQGTERQQLAPDPTEHEGQNQARTCFPKVHWSASPVVSPLQRLPVFMKCPLLARLCAGHWGHGESKQDPQGEPRLSEETDIEQIIADVLTK